MRTRLFSESHLRELRIACQAFDVPFVVSTEDRDVMMRSICAVSWAALLSAGMASAGAAATSNDSVSNATPGATTAPNVQPPPAATVPKGSSQYQTPNQPAPYASGQPSPGTSTGPTGSVRRDATNPHGAGNGGGDNKN